MSGDIFFILIIWRVFHHQAFGTFGFCNCLWGMRRWVIWGFETFPELDRFWIGVVVYCFAYPQNQLVKRFWFVCINMVACSTDNLKTKSMCTLCKQKNTYWYTKLLNSYYTKTFGKIKLAICCCLLLEKSHYQIHITYNQLFFHTRNGYLQIHQIANKI